MSLLFPSLLFPTVSQQTEPLLTLQEGKVFQVWFTSSLANLLNYNPKSHHKASESGSLCQNSRLFSKLVLSLTVPNAKRHLNTGRRGCFAPLPLPLPSRTLLGISFPSKPEAQDPLSVPYVYGISLQIETVPRSKSLHTRAFPLCQSAV